MHCDSDGRYTMFTFKCLTPYRSIRRTTASCYYSAFREGEEELGMSEVDPLYESVGNLFCSDGDRAVARAERALALAAPPSTLRLQTTCNIRRCSTAREEATEQEDSVVADVRHLVLSLRTPGGRKMFRRAMRISILRCLKIVRDRLPNQASVRNSKLYIYIYIKQSGLGLISGLN